MKKTDKDHLPDNGMLLIYKNSGLTSFQTINCIKKKLSLKKIGHSGTLDKPAEGLLLVCYGRATKLLTYLIGLPKVYKAEFTFGKQTTTDDAEGDVIKSYDGSIDFATIIKYKDDFLGKIKQIPPNYSSVHVDGKRAYKLALDNKEINFKLRNIEIFNIEIDDFTDNRLTLTINCSSGTYIRSIARDWGNNTGYYAHCNKLKRVSVGNFTIEDAVKPDDLDDCFTLFEPEDILNEMPSLIVKSEFIQDLKNGKPMQNDWFIGNYESNKIYKILYKDKLTAIISTDNNELKYKTVYNVT